MKFESAGDVEAIVWDMRINDLPRGDNRTRLNRLYNGNPTYTVAEAEENKVQVNRNFLTGTNILSTARGQWNNAFFKQPNYFGVTLDSGPVEKRQDWGHIITRNINRQLKRCRSQMEGIRADGANVILHGIAPSSAINRRNPIFKPMPVSSLLIPDETDLDFENLEYFAVFREWTPHQFWNMTHGLKIDPGWNMEAVYQQWDYIKDQMRKEPNASAFQYMPERIEELVKQGGIWGTDCVPTVDVWDFYFRQANDGDGWYRRIILDWGVAAVTESTGKPESRNISKEKGGFLYLSGKRKFASHLGEILQCQFGDCSAVAPFKYHSVRSLGWMLWGVCELENRLRCRFSESAFMNMMWWFRCASGGDFDRVKKAMFEHIGVIPSGIQMLTANERFVPDKEIVEFMFEQLQATMNQSAGAFAGNPADLGKEETATGTMARVHAVSQLMGGMMTLAYEYARYKYQEQARRFCLKNSPYKMVRDFRAACLHDGVPEEMLDSSRWNIEPDRALGEGNKILQMGIATGLEGIRKNLSPDAQRKVDHIYIATLTDRPDLAEDLAPIEGQKRISPSTHDAQLASDRLLRGLQFSYSPEMIPEDYVLVWLGDMAAIIKQIQGRDNTGTAQEIAGLTNLGAHIAQFLKLMDTGEGHGKGQKGDPEQKHKIKQYSDVLHKLLNFVKGFEQRLKEKTQAGNGNRIGADELARIQLDRMKAQAKMQTQGQAHAAKEARHQAGFELEQQRKDRETNAEIRRENARTAQTLIHDHLGKVQEIQHNMLREDADDQTETE